MCGCRINELCVKVVSQVFVLKHYYYFTKRKANIS